MMIHIWQLDDSHHKSVDTAWGHTASSPSIIDDTLQKSATDFPKPVENSHSWKFCFHLNLADTAQQVYLSGREITQGQTLWLLKKEKRDCTFLSLFSLDCFPQLVMTFLAGGQASRMGGFRDLDDFPCGLRCWWFYQLTHIFCLQVGGKPQASLQMHLKLSQTGNCLLILVFFSVFTDETGHTYKWRHRLNRCWSGPSNERQLYKSQ